MTGTKTKTQSRSRAQTARSRGGRTNQRRAVRTRSSSPSRSRSPPRSRQRVGQTRRARSVTTGPRAAKRAKQPRAKTAAPGSKAAKPRARTVAAGRAGTTTATAGPSRRPRATKTGSGTTQTGSTARSKVARTGTGTGSATTGTRTAKAKTEATTVTAKSKPSTSTVNAKSKPSTSTVNVKSKPSNSTVKAKTKASTGSAPRGARSGTSESRTAIAEASTAPTGESSTAPATIEASPQAVTTPATTEPSPQVVTPPATDQSVCARLAMERRDVVVDAGDVVDGAQKILGSMSTRSRAAQPVPETNAQIHAEDDPFNRFANAAQEAGPEHYEHNGFLSIHKRGSGFAPKIIQPKSPSYIPPNETWPVITKRMDEEIEKMMRRHSDTYLHPYKICGTRMSVDDLWTFKDSVWLDDEVIDCYLQMIIDRNIDEGLRSIFALRCSVTKLMFATRTAHRNLIDENADADDIFDFSIIFFPINIGSHWRLIAVDTASKIIVALDSLARNNFPPLNKIETYLVKEYGRLHDQNNEKYPLPPEEFFKDWKKFHQRVLPRQLNMNDCGVFLLQYADHLARDVPLAFGQENMPYFRRLMTYEVMRGELLPHCIERYIIESASEDEDEGGDGDGDFDSSGED